MESHMDGSVYASFPKTNNENKSLEKIGTSFVKFDNIKPILNTMKNGCSLEELLQFSLKKITMLRWTYLRLL